MRPLLPCGTSAPDFVLAGSDGREYRLLDLCAGGAVALFFYPGNDTPG